MLQKFISTDKRIYWQRQ